MQLSTLRVFFLGLVLGVVAFGSIAVIAAADDTEPNVASPAERRVLRSLDMFERAQQFRDVVPAWTMATLRSLEGDAAVPEELRPGSLLPASSRMLMNDIGPQAADVYALRTSKGQVCLVVTDGPQTCVTAFEEGIPVSWSIFDYDGLHKGSPTSVVGLTTDKVAGVEVTGTDGLTRARMVENVYYAQLRDGSSLPTALSVTLTTGEKLRVQLPDLSAW